MPRYDFWCGQCQATLEVVLAMWRDSLDESRPIYCPMCNRPMEKQPSAPNFTVGGKFTAKNNYGAKND